MIIINDCIEAMREMEENSVDAIVTDPPYGLEFMGKTWDKLDAPDATALTDPAEAGGFQDGAGGNPYSRGRVRHGKKASLIAMVAWHENWAREALRVLKPGGHMLVFGGSRTYHSMAMGVELAGFEIRDQIQWVYATGFPKSMNVGKAIDKRGGYPQLAAEIGQAIKAARESRELSAAECDKRYCGGKTNWSWFEGRPRGQRAPTPETFAKIAKDWTELAPLASKVAQAEREVVGKSENQVGVGWADEGNAGYKPEFDITAPATDAAKQWDGWGTALKPAHEPIVMARKPLKGTVAANVLLHGTGAINVDGCRVGTEGATTRSGQTPYGESGWRTGHDIVPVDKGRWPSNFIHDGSDEATEGLGAAARYFYCAKPSKREKNAGLGDDFETKQVTGGGGLNNPSAGAAYGSIKAPGKNHHPTVKPVALMAYLCRLVTPPGGIVLDPFAGSGTTGVAAIQEGFKFIGIEREAEYAAIAEARIGAAAPRSGRAVVVRL